MSVAIQSFKLPVQNDTLIQWYDAESDLGVCSLGISIDTETLMLLEGPRRVLRQGLLLDKVELVIQALELWLGVELDLIPVGLTNTPVNGSDSLEALINAPAVTDLPKVILRIPLSALDKIAQADTVLTDQLNFQWSPLPFCLWISELSLSQSEYADIEAGALILMPNSFTQSWVVRGVFSALESTVIEGILNSVEGCIDNIMLIPETGAEQNEVEIPASTHKVRLCPVEAVNIDPGRIFGFAASNNKRHIDLEQTNIQLECRGRVVGLGRLTRIAKGYGFVMLESVD